MNYYLGVDLGTSSLKCLVIDREGKTITECSESYPVSFSHPGWSEQDPLLWWEAFKTCVKAHIKPSDRAQIRAISFGGQMHGLVVLDAHDTVLRPCILWNDGRSVEQTAFLNDSVGKETLTQWTGNIAFPGFTAPKILWMKEHEPENFAKIAKIMLPKDYLVYRLSGIFATDYSDASGTLLLDVKNRRWSKPMLELCDLHENQLPHLYPSAAVVGRLLPSLAQELGLSPDVQIIAGAGDNAAAAIGTGTVADDACNVSLGTSGTIFLVSPQFSVDSHNALHSFCDANGKWHWLGCILSAAGARKWWLEEILKTPDYTQNEQAIASLETNVLFLPYLMGERSPHNDVNARGAFVGLTLSTTPEEMGRAVMEGVTFALRDCLEAAHESGIYPTSTTLCGGGAKSDTWVQLVADILNMPVRLMITEQGPAFGAAILAMVGNQEFSTIQEAAQHLIKTAKTINPSGKDYEAKYALFHRLYPALKTCFEKE